MTTGCVRGTKMKVLLMYEIKSRQNDYASESEDEKEEKKNIQTNNKQHDNNKFVHSINVIDVRKGALFFT